MQECPTCGEGFETERGMKVHHSKVHGESIAYEEFTCLNCGEEEEYHPSYEQGKFCKHSCFKEYVQENPHVYEPEFDVNPAKRPEVREKLRKTWEEKEISQERYDRFMENRIDPPSGKDHPNYVERVEWSCDWCGDTEMKTPHAAEKDRFCNQECYGAWRSRNLVGENAPTWDPNTDYKWKKDCGSSWTEELRQSIRERDGFTCQSCGTPQEDLLRKLDVHHMIPFSEYGLENHKKANRPENLVSLCRPCHISIEASDIQHLFEPLATSQLVSNRLFY